MNKCKRCAVVCTKSNFVCTHCNVFVYCSKICMLEAWPQHRESCYDTKRRVYAAEDVGNVMVKLLDNSYQNYERQKLCLRFRKRIGLVYEEYPQIIPTRMISNFSCRRCKSDLRPHNSYVCPNCKIVKYCNIMCFFNDWITHRESCFNGRTGKYATEDRASIAVDTWYLEFDESKLIRKIKRQYCKMLLPSTPLILLLTGNK